MTRPDVEALADCFIPDGWGRDEQYDFGDAFGLSTANIVAEAIIAALAASGWRITSAPEASQEPPEPRAGPDEVATADEAARAQGAPDLPTTEAGLALLRFWQAHQRLVHGVGGDALPQDFIAIEQAAVRAALEGLRAEVVAAQGGEAWIEDVVLALIDARLADLP